MLSMLLQPWVGFGLFLAAALLARPLLNLIPEGRVKAFLTQPQPLIPRTESERRNWMPVFWLFLAQMLVFGMIWLFGHLL